MEPIENQSESNRVRREGFGCTQCAARPHCEYSHPPLVLQRLHLLHACHSIRLGASAITGPRLGIIESTPDAGPPAYLGRVRPSVPAHRSLTLHVAKSLHSGNGNVSGHTCPGVLTW